MRTTPLENSAGQRPEITFEEWLRTMYRPIAGGEQPPATSAQSVQATILDPASAGGPPVAAPARAQDTGGAPVVPAAPAAPAPGAPEGQPAAPAAAPAVAEQPILTLEQLRAKYPSFAKFPDLGKMAEAHLGLERLFTRYRQADLDPEEAFFMLQRQLTGGEAAAAGEGEPEAGQEMTDDEFLALLAENPREAVRQLIRAETMPDREARAFDTAKSMWADARGKHPDIDQYEPEMVRLLQEMPMIVQLEDAVDRLYNLAKFGNPASAEATITQAQLAERNRVLQGVRQGSVEGGTGGGAPPIKQPTEAERITASILAAEPARPVLRPLTP